MADFKGSQVENSLKDGTGDDIGGAEVDANPFAIADGLDGTTSLTWGDSGTIDFGGSYSKAAWGLSGVDFRVNASTFTDSGTSGSGTATNAVAWSWARPTFAATNSSVTMTNAATMYIANAPAAGTNVTLTNAYALWVDAGAVRFDGILNLDGSIDADVTDVDIASSGDIDLTSTSNAADAIYLRTNAGTSETIKIHADQGTSVTEGASSVQLLSDAGGVELKSTANLAKSIKLIADGGTSETIYIQADQGTSESSIQLVSDAGGIDIDAAAGKNVDIAGGQINLTSSDDAASAIYLRANAGTSETIKIHADQGSGAGSITLVSDAGGIDVDAAGGVTIDSVGISLDASAASNFTTSSGALTITSAAAATWSTAAGALTVNGTTGINLQEGGSDIITISNSRAVATANTASIDLDASGAITMNSSGGTLSIGNDNVDQVVNLATAGTRTLNIGINDGTDVTTIVSKGNITNTGTLTVGVNDTGHDVQMFGAAAGAYLLWDESANALDIRGATAAGPGAISLETGETTVVDGDILGRIDFSAPAEGDGTDAVLVGASIWAESDDTFAADNNATSLVFAAATSETAAAVMRLSKTALTPQTTDGLSLGTSALNFSDLFLDDGAVINFNSGDVTVTHSSNTLTVSGGTFATAALTATSLDLNGNADISGNAAIGKGSAASYPLEVETGNNNDWVAQIRNTDATDGENYGLRVRGGSTSADTALAVEDHDGANALLTVKGDGNVTIRGRSSPTLVVEQHSANAPAYIDLKGVRASVDEDLGYLRGYWNTNLVAEIRFDAGQDATAKDEGQIMFRTAGAGGAMTNRMRITDTGNVGIGETSPSAPLHITTTGTTDANVIWEGPNSTWSIGPDYSDSGIFKVSNNPAVGTSTSLEFLGSNNINVPNGILFIGDTANTEMTVGLTINQGAADNEILALKSSDVGHTFTDFAENDTYGTFQKGSATGGCARLSGFGDAQQAVNTNGALELFAYNGSYSDTKVSGSKGAIRLSAGYPSGSDVQAIGSNGNLVNIDNDGTTRFIFDADGDSHQDVGTAWTNMDDEHDALVTRSLGLVMDRASAIRTKWDDWGRNHKEDLERTGIIPILTQEQIDNGERALVNTTQVMRLHNGALWQLYTQIMDMCEKLEDNVPSLKGKLLPQGA